MANPGQTGLFVPQTDIWDVTPIYEADVNSIEFKNLLAELYRNLSFMSVQANKKDAGYYDNANEFVCGQLYFPNPALSSSSQLTPVNRQVFRKVVYFPNGLPNATSSSLPHNINPNSTFSFTRMYGCASDQSGLNYIPIPYSDTSSLNNNISLSADSTNVTITTGSNRSNFNIAYAILEYIKN